MKPAKPIRVAALGLLLLPAAGRHLSPAPPRSLASIAHSPLTRPNTPFERSLRQGWKLRSQALLAEIGECKALGSWGPRAAAGVDETTLREETLAQDRSGDLQRARAAAEKAAILARTPAEGRRAAMLRLLIERDLDYQTGRAKPGSAELP